MIKKFEFKKFIKLVVFLIFFISAIFGIVSFFFNLDYVYLKYEIISDVSVLDLNTDISNLKIFYKEIDLIDSKKEIRLISLKISNTGTKDVLKEYYDDNDPLGFIVQNGVLVENPILILASNDYLTDNVKILSNSNNIVTFPKILIDSNDFFIIKILVLHDIDKRPLVVPKGKISGQKVIEVFTTESISEPVSLTHQTFYGNTIIQFFRVFTYGFIGLALIMFILFSEDIFKKLLKFYKKCKLIKEFKNRYLYKYIISDKVIFKFFLKFSGIELIFAYEILSDEEGLNRSVKKIIDENFYKSRKVSKGHYSYEECPPIALHLVKLGFAKKINERYIADTRLQEVLLMLIKFLNEKEFFEPADQEKINKLLKL